MPTSTAAVPERTAQRMASLKLANTVRITNAKALKQIAEKPCVDGIDAVIAILKDGDEKGPIGALPIGRLLTAPRRIGDERMRVVLRTASILSADRRLRQITMRQRRILAAGLEASAPSTRRR